MNDESKCFGETDFAVNETRWLAETKLAEGERSLEAAGVEPASEGTSSRDSTCVSASFFSCPA